LDTYQPSNRKVSPKKKPSGSFHDVSNSNVESMRDEFSEVLSAQMKLEKMVSSLSLDVNTKLSALMSAIEKYEKKESKASSNSDIQLNQVKHKKDKDPGLLITPNVLRLQLSQKRTLLSSCKSMTSLDTIEIGSARIDNQVTTIDYENQVTTIDDDS
jgi:hypothetical protein